MRDPAFETERVLGCTDHRPWPLPARPWVMTQRWHDLLFLHWPLDPARLRALVPQGLQLDCFEGRSWIGVVPFWMSQIRMRGMPRVPGFSSFPELNVRTYVTVAGRPGVYFFSLDAASRLAVAVARRWFRLPYYHARMAVQHQGDAVRYHSRRIHHGAAEFRAHYAPEGGVRSAGPGSLEHWLTERYCLYTTNRRGTIWRGEIHHRPWPLQPAKSEIEMNTVVEALDLGLPAAPELVHVARRLDVLVWTPEQVEPQ